MGKIWILDNQTLCASLNPSINLDANPNTESNELCNKVGKGFFPRNIEKSSHVGTKVIATI